MTLLRWIAAVALGLAFVSLVWRATLVLAAAAAAIPFPASLDYGEGIVLQQAMMMTGPGAYGDITEAPFIVFHYPPIYHLTIRLLGLIAGATGAELVTVGRLTSLLAAMASAVAVGAIAAAVAPDGLDRRRRIATGIAAGLLAFGTIPFALWLPYARVDMLALAFTMAGLALAVRAGTSRARLYGAILLFVLAVFAKQTSLAAPTAVVAALMLRDRRRALEAVAVGLALALPMLGLAQWLTDGSFLRHVVGYNVNRFEFGRLWFLVPPFILQLPMVLVVVIGLLSCRRGDCAIRPPALTIVLIHFLLCSIMLGLIGKSGSSVNYLLEWFCSAAIVASIAFGNVLPGLSQPPRSLLTGPAGGLLIGALLAIQGAVLPDPRHALLSAPSQAAADTLLRLVERADRPPIGDDMVVVLRAGKVIPWEPSIFAELASLGRWDESLIIDAIRGGQFSMAITQGARGDTTFDSRYNAAVADAMDAAWPQKARLGWLTLHLPADAPLPAGAVPGSPRSASGG